MSPCDPAAECKRLALDLTDPAALRRAIRGGTFRAFTNGLAPGYVQAAPVIMPKAYAADFVLYCQRNARPLPLLAVSDPGDPGIPEVARDLDIRTDVGVYQIYRDGVMVGTRTDIRELWQDDLVTIVLGCSFSFEHALMEAGVPLRHIEEGNVSPMYPTSIDTVPVGPFASKLIVSMRFFRPADAIRAIQVSSRYPAFHGAPVHIGKPGMIGVDPSRSYGGHGLKEGRDDELPVFWACSAVAQFAIESARLPLAITHAKAHMLVTDLRIRDFEV